MPSITITWRIKDLGACPICKELEGWFWTFEGGEGIPEQLVHPDYGVVWTRTAGSEAHAVHKGSCRCHLEPEFDLKDLLEKTQKLHDMVQAAYEGGTL